MDEKQSEGGQRKIKAEELKEEAEAKLKTMLEQYAFAAAKRAAERQAQVLKEGAATKQFQELHRARVCIMFILATSNTLYAALVAH